MLIQAFNPDVSQYEQTGLSVPSTIGATALTVRNANLFANGNKILVGAMAREKSEIATVSGSPTATNLPTSALVFPHSTDDPVYALRFDQIRFYRSTTGIAGTYSLLTTVNIDVDNIDQSTYYDDTAGLTTYYYKVSYYNSVTLVESLQGDPIPATGYDPMSAGSVIDQVASEVGDKEFSGASRDDYFAWLNEVNWALQKRMRKPYDFLKTDVVKNAVAGQGIDYPTDLLHFDTLEYTYTGNGLSRIYNPTPVYYDQWIALTTEPAFNLPNDQIENVYYDDVNKKIYTYPLFATNQTGTVKIHYWKKFTYITGDGSTLETIDPQVYKTYLKGMYYRKKAAREERFAAISDRWMSDYAVELAQVVKYNRKNIGQPQSFRSEPRPSLTNGRRLRYK